MDPTESKIATYGTPVPAFIEKAIPRNSKSTRFWLCLLTALVTIILVATAYHPTLFNFLLIDDFYFLTWLKEASKDPALPIQVFLHHYMRDAYYYRPLIILIWTIEYLICGTNGFLLRLGSIAIMLVTGLILGLLVSEIAKTSTPNYSSSSKIQLMWPLFSAVLFACYPLHSEPVNWFAAQHDLWVTLFCLISFWCYIQWQKLEAVHFFVLSIFSYALGLLTKEMAVTFPLVLLSCKVLCSRDESLNWSLMSTRTLSTIFPYLLTLILYFLLRKMALGTFIGTITNVCCDGYRNDYFAIIHIWWRNVQRIFVPIDTSVISQLSITTMFWQIAITVALILSVYAFKKTNTTKLFVFLCLWFIFSLMPRTQYFAIGSSLEGSRATYLATVPVCLLLTYGMAYLYQASKYSYLSCTAYGALLSLSTLILYCNNRAYSYFGQTSNKIISELRTYYGKIGDDPQTKILDLPFLTGCVPDLTKKPFLQRDILNCNFLNASDQFIPFGYLKNCLNTKENKIKFLFWDKRRQKLKPTIPYCSIPPVINFPAANYKKTWNVNELKSIIRLGSGSPGKLSWETNQILHLVSNRRSYLEINLKEFPCWPIDFISFKVKILVPHGQNLPRQFDLRFANSIAPDCYWLKPVSMNTVSRVQILPTEREQDLTFPLRNHPDWVLGGKCKNLKLLVPPQTDMKLVTMCLPEANTVIPIVTGSSSKKLSYGAEEQVINYDASHIKGCTQVVLEVIGREKFFETLYSDEADKGALFNIRSDKVIGTLKVQRSAFHEKGYYLARMKALDKKGRQAGLAGDHFTINFY